jgi:prepilin peptidase CpaA
MTIALFSVLVLFPLLVAYAAASDLVSMTISNQLCLVLIGAFGVCAFATGMTLHEFGMHAAAGTLMLVICFGCFAAGWIGGGDAKLSAAIALWFGFEPLMSYVMISTMAGGVLTLAILKYRASPMPHFAIGWSWARMLHGANKGVPYGIALSFAALMVLPQTQIWRSAIGLT